jgi:hypothetical protein
VAQEVHPLGLTEPRSKAKEVSPRIPCERKPARPLPLTAFLHQHDLVVAFVFGLAHCSSSDGISERLNKITGVQRIDGRIWVNGRPQDLFPPPISRGKRGTRRITTRS